MPKVELTLEGRVSAESGKLLIIDPCYLEGFDVSFIREYVERQLSEYSQKCSELELERLESFRRHLKELKKCNELLENLWKERDDKSRRGFVKHVYASSERSLNEHKKQCNRITEGIDALEKEPSVYPPWLVQGHGYACFRNCIGDGHYPIVKLTRGIFVVFKYSVTSCASGEIIVGNGRRLKGKVLGRSWVDSGAQIVIDPNKVTVRDNVPSYAYRTVDVTRGEYLCEFIDDDGILSIRKN